MSTYSTAFTGTERQEVADRIFRRIQLLRRSDPNSSEWVRAEIDVLRRRLAVLSEAIYAKEVRA